MNGSAAQLAQESFYGEKESQLLFGLRFELFNNYILECMCSTQFPFCTGYNWKGDSKLVMDPACKSDVYTVDCTSKGC